LPPRHSDTTHKAAAACSSYNEEMLRVMLLILVAAATFAQTPPATPDKAAPQAPPEVDAALQARVKQFYQLEVEGKFNQALQLVAEDTKDFFVGSSKPTYQSFELQNIRYSGDFTKADVIVLVSRLLPIQGFMGHPLPTRIPSHWKLENGLWCFYVDPQKDLPISPFGPLAPPPGMALPTGSPAGSPRPLPPMPANLPDPRLLTADRLSIQLKSSGPSSEQVTISNSSPWFAALTLSDPKVAGLTVSLDRFTLQHGEKAVLSIRSSGGVQIPKTPITIAVTVEQTKQTIPIKVSFAN
jgi:hypothetical protein